MKLVLRKQPTRRNRVFRLYRRVTGRRPPVIFWGPEVFIETNDLWVGVFHRPVNIASGGYRWGREFYVILMPALVVKFAIWRHA